jgi:S-disulfanyl-L-cysteine oxidoreductase SoxD
MPRPFFRTVLIAGMTTAIVGAAATAATATPSRASVGSVARSVNASAPVARPMGVHDSVGLYSEAQAQRGLEVFTAVCSECHEVEDLTNADFRANWDGTTLYELFDNIRTTMPDENPGTLTQQQYIDVTAYVLQLNKLPSGPDDFTGDSTAASAVRLPLPSGGN